MQLTNSVHLTQTNIIYIASTPLGQSMGNKIGAMVSRIPGENLGHDDDFNDNEHNDPAILAQERLIQVHRVLNERKQTPAAVLSLSLIHI